MGKGSSPLPLTRATLNTSVPPGPDIPRVEPTGRCCSRGRAAEPPPPSRREEKNNNEPCCPHPPHLIHQEPLMIFAVPSQGPEGAQNAITRGRVSQAFLHNSLSLQPFVRAESRPPNPASLQTVFHVRNWIYETTCPSSTLFFL